MSKALGYCEHMISSQATCKPCAIKLEERIALLEDAIEGVIHSYETTGNVDASELRALLG